MKTTAIARSAALLCNRYHTINKTKTARLSLAVLNFAVKTAILVEATGFEPAESLAPKASAIPSFATPRCVKIWSFPILVKIVVKTLFGGGVRQRDLGFLPFFSRFLAFLKVGGRSDHLLPNVARYQLRHTPKDGFYYSKECVGCQGEFWRSVIFKF